MTDINTAKRVNLTEPQIILIINNYFSRAEIQIQQIKKLVKKVEAGSDGRLVTEAYIKIKNFIFNLDSMQKLLNNSSSDLGIASEFRSAASLRFKAFNTQISDLQESFDNLATEVKTKADELPNTDLTLSSPKGSNTSKQSEPSPRMEVDSSSKKDLEKKQTSAPSKDLNEMEETARWIEELRQRKSSKKVESLSKGNENQCDSSDELLRQQHLQEELAGSLVSMAGILKSNSLAFGDALNKDEQVLDEAQAALDTNLDRLTAEGRRLKLISSSASSATLLYYLSILLVVMVFIMTAVYIRLNPKLK